MGSDGLVLDLENAEIGERHHIKLGRTPISLYELPSSPLIAPMDSLRALYGISEPGHVELFKSFDDHGFDGMRCDVDGNLYVTRYGKGVVVKLSPAGEVLAEIDVLGKQPSNICFGGPDGRTAYVTEVEHTRIVSFRVERPGLCWSRLNGL